MTNHWLAEDGQSSGHPTVKSGRVQRIQSGQDLVLLPPCKLLNLSVPLLFLPSHGDGGTPWSYPQIKRVNSCDALSVIPGREEALNKQQLFFFFKATHIPLPPLSPLPPPPPSLSKSRAEFSEEHVKSMPHLQLRKRQPI